jgi:hypothetical protein
LNYTNTFICRLDGSGSLDSVASTFSNPAFFWERSVYAINGKSYVTATTGRIYRMDGLPEPPAPTANQVLALDGSGDHVTIPSAADLQNPSEITVEA